MRKIAASLLAVLPLLAGAQDAAQQPPQPAPPQYAPPPRPKPMYQLSRWNAGRR